MSPWDGPPSEGPWLHAGMNSRMSHSKVKAGLFREIHTPQPECELSQKARAAAPGHGVQSQMVRAVLGETHSTDRMWTVSKGKRGPEVWGGFQFLWAG